MLLIPFSAFLASVALHCIALKVFPRLKLLDFPERYGLTRRRLPYPTGIIAVVLFPLFWVLVMPMMTLASTALLFSVITLGICCVVDDRWRLPPAVRLGVQALLALLLFLSGVRLYSLTNPLGQLTGVGVISLDTWTMTLPYFGSVPLVSGIFTVLWLLLTINALNWFDGIPGQVSTLSTIAFMTIGLLALSSRVNEPMMALIAFIAAGLSLGGLFFDFPPATVLMGDTGAMFYGLLIGVFTMYSGGKVATAFLVLGVPLFDLVFVVFRRIARGQSPLTGDRTDQHLHHRLLKKGWSEKQVILLTATIGTAFGVTALFLNTVEKFVAAIVLFGVMVGLSLYSENRKSEIRNKSE